MKLPSVIAATIVLQSGIAMAQSHNVYVESNAPAGNQVFAYRQNSDGSLTALPGSPYNAGGAGFADASFALGPFDSDQNLALNDDHTLLFAVNSGANTIAVFHVAQDGTLAAVAGSPFYSHGINPVSVGYSDGLLAVVNKSQDPNQSENTVHPNYTLFQVAPNGALTHITGSTVAVAYGSSPSQALLQDGYLFGADFLGGLVQSFRVGPSYIEQNAPQPAPVSEYAGSTAPRFPLGLATVRSERVLYAGLVTLNRVAVYRYDQTAHLEFVRSVANSGAAPCWIVTDEAHHRMYTGNAGDHSVTVYDISHAETPVQLQSLKLNAVGGVFQLALANGYLYAVEQHSSAAIPEGTGNALHVLRIGFNGQLSEVAASPVPLNVPGIGRAQGVAAF